MNFKPFTMENNRMMDIENKNKISGLTAHEEPNTHKSSQPTIEREKRKNSKHIGHTRGEL